MNKALESILKVFLLLVGFILQIFSLFLLIKSEFLLALIFFIIGFCLSIFAKNLYDFKLFIVKASIALGVLFLMGGFFTFSLNQSSSDIADSIQPSIDFLLVSSIDQVIEENVYKDEVEEVKLILGKNKQVEVIYSSNMTIEQARFISNSFSFGGSDDEALFLSRFVVDLIYAQLKEQGIEKLGIPIESVSEQNSEVSEQINEIDFSLFEQFCSFTQEEIEQALSLAKLLEGGDQFSLISAEQISSSCEGNPEAFLNIITFEEEIIKNVDPNNLEDEDINLIWENLELPEVSQSSKETITKIALSVISDETENLGIEDSAIPVASISEIIPEDVKSLVSYDILSDNLSKRTEALEKIREDCSEEGFSITEICDAIHVTEYENFIQNISGFIEDNPEMFDLPVNISSALESVNTIEKVEKTIQEPTSNYRFFFILALSLFTLSVFTAFMHKGDEENTKDYGIKMGKFLSKINLIDVLTYYLLLSIVYFLFASGFLFEKIKEFIEEEVVLNIFDIVIELPLIKVIMELIETLFFIVTFYVIFSLVFYLIFYFINHFKTKNKGSEE